MSATWEDVFMNESEFIGLGYSNILLMYTAVLSKFTKLSES